MRKPRLYFLILGLLSLTALAATAASAQTVKVLQRKRLGNQTEDITFVSNGPLAGSVAILDGDQVGGIHRGQRARGLFDLFELGIRVSPRGIVYMPSEALFAVNDGTEVSTLFLVDSHGQAEGTRTIQYLNGFIPDFLEGMAYIPPTSQSFPDDLIVVANSFVSNQAYLEVMERNGLVVDEIVATDFTYITGVAFHAPDRILVSSDNNIWDLDFSGNIVAGPVSVDGAGDLEGLAQVSNGDIAAADYDAAKLFMFDRNLNRLPNLDRNYKIGLGVSVPNGLAWNSDTNQYLVAHNGFSPAETQEIVSIPPALNSATQVVNLAADGYDGRKSLSYLPDKHLIAGTDRPSRQILLFDNNGNLAGQIDLSAFGTPSALDYIPTTKQFAVKFNNAPLMIDIIDGKGNLVRSIDLSSTALDAISGMAFFNPSDPSGGEFLVLGSSGANIALITDFLGDVKGEFNYREALGVINPTDVAAITTGSQKGAFSLVDNGNSQLVVFTVQ
jgi:uncharacterized protein YjiK